MKTAPFRNQLGFWGFALVALTGVASCGGDDDDHDGEGGSGAVCPPGNTLTYENFGRGFMSTYCTRCHSSTLSGDMRQGAPADHNFDTRAGILKMAEHIDEQAAAGPTSVNTAMPPSDPKPPEDERRKLGEWLACETSDDDGGDGTSDSGTSDGGSGDGGSRADSGGNQSDANRDSRTDGGRSGG